MRRLLDGGAYSGINVHGEAMVSNVTAWNGSPVPTNGNTQLDKVIFLLTWVRLVYYLTRKTQNFNSLFPKISRFLQNETLHCRDSSTLGPSKLNKRFHNFTWSGFKSEEIVNFVPIMGPTGSRLNDVF